MATVSSLADLKGHAEAVSSNMREHFGLVIAARLEGCSPILVASGSWLPFMLLGVHRAGRSGQQRRSSPLGLLKG